MRTVGIACLALLALIRRPASARFTLAESYIGQDFLDPKNWNWWTDVDPTEGRVDYVDRETALARNLTFVSNGKFFMRADDTNIVPPNARGRASIRINSTVAYDESIIVLDVQHMPAGCATWPAFWTLSEKGTWPDGGEVDILEGVNLATQNSATLHTDPNCTANIPSRVPVFDNCESNHTFNQGCGVAMSKPASYGAPFNEAGGGYFAILRTKHALEGPQVRVWFWSRADPRVPREIKYAPKPGFFTGQPSIYPTPLWGLPEADFPLREQCEYDSHFDPHLLTFDLTFCGQWAGEVYATSGCPSNCIDYVDNNPQAFSEAYWEINSLRVYTPGAPRSVPTRRPGPFTGNAATSGSLLNLWRASRGKM
ncbi:concanavalin A-like lectin/glucanase domain-containing protein [Daedaleopsis nitida]|nr:concanavalin A-like lectin/glucanase domain-containing protein [Daedaleopsis nitida]